MDGPNSHTLTGDRVTELKFLNGSQRVIMDNYRGDRDQQTVLANRWIGTTTFLKKAPPDNLKDVTALALEPSGWRAVPPSNEKASRVI